MNNPTEHWDKIFYTTDNCNLGWFEKDVTQTLKFLDLVPDYKNIFISGVGTSYIVETLLKKNYNLTLNDISKTALEKIQQRVQDKSIKYLAQDISTPLQENITCNIWFDRAVLHFLLEEEKIEQYFKNLKNTLTQGGYVLFAEFALDGAPKCAGLELHRYSVKELAQRLGKEFKLIKEETYNYLNPSGDTRKYIYALFQKNNTP